MFEINPTKVGVIRQIYFLLNSENEEEFYSIDSKVCITIHIYFSKHISLVPILINLGNDKVIK